jgi:hypothetical protein
MRPGRCFLRPIGMETVQRLHGVTVRCPCAGRRATRRRVDPRLRSHAGSGPPSLYCQSPVVDPPDNRKPRAGGSTRDSGRTPVAARHRSIASPLLWTLRTTESHAQAGRSGATMHLPPGRPEASAVRQTIEYAWSTARPLDAADWEAWPPETHRGGAFLSSRHAPHAASAPIGFVDPCIGRALPSRLPGRAGCTRSSTTAIG